MKFLNNSTIKQLWVFALAGPPIAALLLLVWVNLSAELPRHDSVGSWLSRLAGLSVFAYLWGLLPALLTGAAAACLRTLVPGHATRARATRLAGTVACGGIASWMLPKVFPGGDAGFTLAASGAAAALVCACWTEWRWHPDRSF
jgi:uncharacterized BrkB/YihY/UPF0761 family membrane protein